MPLELLEAAPPEALFAELLPRPPPPEGEPPSALMLSELEPELHAPTSKGPANRIQSQARILPADFERPWLRPSRAGLGA